MNHYTISVDNTMFGVYRFRYEPVDSNMYFIPLREIGIVFDPNISKELLPLLTQYGIKKIQIILTHEHYDHTNGVEWLQKNIECKLFCQKECARLIASEKNNNPNFVSLVLRTKDYVDGGNRYEEFISKFVNYTLQADSFFEQRYCFAIEQISLDCYSTPGHSPGSACYIIDNKYIFTGDSLIQNTPTILRFKTSNKDAYEQTTRPFLQSLDKNMLVFPGHGEPFKINEAKYL